MVLGNPTKLPFKQKKKKMVFIKDMIKKLFQNKRKSLNHIKHNQGQDKKDEAEKSHHKWK